MSEKSNSRWDWCTDVEKLQKSLDFWNARAEQEKERADWYKEELARTQEILGRVIVQYSERRDDVKLTNYPRRRAS